MALAMIEDDLGRAIADDAAARLVLYMRRPGCQSQFRRRSKKPLPWERTRLIGWGVCAATGAGK